MSSNLLLKANQNKLGSSNRAEINLNGRSKLLNYMSDIKKGIESLRRLKNDCMCAVDQQKEDTVKEEITQIDLAVSKATSCAKEMIRTIRRDVYDRKVKYNDPGCEDTVTRFLESMLDAMQLQLYHLTHQFSSVQIEIKLMFREKMKRKIEMYDPTCNEEQVAELLVNPGVL